MLTNWSPKPIRKDCTPRNKHGYGGAIERDMSLWRWIQCFLSFQGCFKRWQVNLPRQIAVVCLWGSYLSSGHPTHLSCYCSVDSATGNGGSRKPQAFVSERCFQTTSCETPKDLPMDRANLHKFILVFQFCSHWVITFICETYMQESVITVTCRPIARKRLTKHIPVTTNTLWIHVQQ
jgi:hypothetical protein